MSTPRNIVLWLAACLSLAPFARAAPAPTHHLLVVYSNTRLLPANVVADQALRDSLAEGPERVEVYAEFLDMPRFQGPDYERTITTYLEEKYRAHPPGLVMAAGDEALAFLLRTRAQLFPGAPLVHLGVGQEGVRALAPLPADVVGVPVLYDGVGSVELALRWQPDTRRIVVVTGATEWDRSWETTLREGLPRITADRTVEYWSGLPLAELEPRLGQLGKRTIVFCPGFFGDGGPQVFTPRQAAERVALASSAPVYSPYETFLGTGVVGGRMPSYGAMGREAGEIAKSILAGADPASLALPEIAPLRPQLDWRQARRFGIRAQSLAPDTVVHFKQPTFWEAYRGLFLAGSAVILLQGSLIAALLFERRRRRASERRIDLATSAAGLSLWDWSARDAASDPFDRVHPADRGALDRAVRAAVEKREPLNVEYRTVDEDGAVRWFAAYGRRDGGASTRVLGVARDVTDRKLAELQAERDRTALRHVGRVSMLGQLSASIAHQLNQPLAAILGNAEAAQTLLGREPVDLAELRLICADIVSDDHRAAEVIRRLRALFKHGELKLAPVDLNELVAETLELARTDLLMRHVVAVAELAPALPPVQGDRVQLQQVVLNLIVNAADAMSATDEHGRELAIHTASADGGVELCVGDRGPGISPGDLERVFEPFWTTKPSGMGIGLAICRSILDAHGGRLTAANRADGGAEFSVVVPVGNS